MQRGGGMNREEGESKIEDERQESGPTIPSPYTPCHQKDRKMRLVRAPLLIKGRYSVYSSTGGG